MTYHEFLSFEATAAMASPNPDARRLGGLDVGLVSTHLESQSDPEHRARQMKTLIDANDLYAPGATVVNGGNFNSSTPAQPEHDAVTQRWRPVGTPEAPLGKSDWMFSRGLAATEPEVLAALSDHEILTVTVSPVQEGPGALDRR